MIKKVAILLMSLIFLVSVIFYGNVFDFKLDKIQSLVFKQSLIIYGILTDSAALSAVLAHPLIQKHLSSL